MMKAEPALPSVSAHAVAAIGKANTSTALQGTARVSVPILTKTNCDGSTELIHGVTGESLGLCATAEIAESTKRFFR